MAARKKTSGPRASAATKPDDSRLRDLRARLRKAIPQPRCELRHDNAWQLLVATILSAQSTDRMVNKITPGLFERWPTPQDLAAAERAEIEKVVKSTGFFRNKARAIQEASRVLVEEHGGQVPPDIDAVVQLPGVARKTANVVLGTALGIATGIVVDTHAARVARRLQLTAETDPARIERDLCALFPKRSWVDTGHRLVLHGRYVCTARRPRCERCPLNECCPSREAVPSEPWTARARWEREIVDGEPE